jgi:hypothetical protein
MPLEIRAIKRKSTPEEIPEPTHETVTSQETPSANKDNPPSKKKKKLNKTVASEVETKPDPAFLTKRMSTNLGSLTE